MIAPGPVVMSYERWEDYLIQNTCPSSPWDDPLVCADSRNLHIGEPIHSQHRYLYDADFVTAYSFPRTRNGDGKMVWNLVSDVQYDGNTATGYQQGLYDFDDPHCTVGNYCNAGLAPNLVGEIYDISEATANSSWQNWVSIWATDNLDASMPRGQGWISNTWTPNGTNNKANLGDAWILGLANNQTWATEGFLSTNGARWVVHSDDNGNLRQLDEWNVDTGKVIHAIGSYTYTGTITPGAQRTNWFQTGSIYMSPGKVFNSAIIASHAHPNLVDCNQHIEVFYLTREYGFTRHETWRLSNCPVNTAALHCAPQSGLQSPSQYHDADGIETIHRIACSDWSATEAGRKYLFDPDAIAARYGQSPYPNAQTFDTLGDGNILMDGQFAWPGAQANKSWSVSGASLTETKDNTFQNEVALIAPTGNGGATLRQEFSLNTRAAEVAGCKVRVGGRFGRLNSQPVPVLVRLYGKQGKNAWFLLGQSAAGTTTDVAFDSVAWRQAPTLLEFEATVPATITQLRYEVSMPAGSATLVADDLYVVCDPRL
ncbi:MAG TPA: hypothetical protein ENK23_05785 [Sorangium sp.]|nr:hypothetical protein [Sorangium sp.]